MPLRRTSLNTPARWQLLIRAVRIEFARLARREPRIDRELTRFLATAYQLKATADYGIGPTAAQITADEAAAASRQRAASSTPLPKCCRRV
jgi:hypothetical protein